MDVRVSDTELAKLPLTAAQYCNPARPTTFIVGPGNHRRWEIMLAEYEDPREMEKLKNVWRLLAPWLEQSEGSLWRASSYRFHALLAAQWRKGNVFLAGDAAHQQPPFIGQGIGRARAMSPVTRQEIVPPLEAGLLANSPHPANGTLLPQPWTMTEDGAVHMDVLTGCGWRLFLDGEADAAAASVALAGLPMVIGGPGLEQQDGIVAHWFARQACAFDVVRPDYYVCGVASTLEEVKTLLDELRATIFRVPQPTHGDFDRANAASVVS